MIKGQLVREGGAAPCLPAALRAAVLTAGFLFHAEGGGHSIQVGGRGRAPAEAAV